MPISMEIQGELDQARARMGVRREIMPALFKLSLAARRSLLLDLLAEVDEESAVAGRAQLTLPIPSQQKPSRPFSDVLREMLDEAKDGIDPFEAAARLYPNKDASRARHNARSIFRWLEQRGEATLSHGRWYARKRTSTTHAKAQARPNTGGGVPDLVLRVISDAGTPLTSAQIVEQVRHLRPNVDPMQVYKSTSRMVKSHKLARGGRGPRKLFSLPNGGRHP
jgi:hypothetical protein